jgi:hypothetical protein
MLVYQTLHTATDRYFTLHFRQFHEFWQARFAFAVVFRAKPFQLCLHCKVDTVRLFWHTIA